jgi:hypothetical protein
MIKAGGESRNRLRVALAVIVLMNLTGCKPSAYRDPISKFQSAASLVIAGSRLYVTELNKVERDHYIDGKVHERGTIRIDEIEDVQVFSRDGLKARLNALDQLANYATLLSDLAHSDAPERIRAEAMGLGAAMDTLSLSVHKLKNPADGAFRSSFGPAAIIVGEICGLIVARDLDQALNKAILQGERPINNLLLTIQSDIAIAYELKRNSLSDMRVARVDDYNNELQKGADAGAEKLKSFAEKIKAHEDRWEAFAVANPSEALNAMAQAHTALVKYAKSSHSDVDLKSLVDAIESFVARATSISDAVQVLRGN